MIVCEFQLVAVVPAAFVQTCCVCCCAVSVAVDTNVVSDRLPKGRVHFAYIYMYMYTYFMLYMYIFG